jgi:hypothetical protein
MSSARGITFCVSLTDVPDISPEFASTIITTATKSLAIVAEAATWSLTEGFRATRNVRYNGPVFTLDALLDNESTAIKDDTLRKDYINQTIFWYGILPITQHISVLFTRERIPTERVYAMCMIPFEGSIEDLIDQIRIWRYSDGGYPVGAIGSYDAIILTWLFRLYDVVVPRSDIESRTELSEMRMWETHRMGERSSFVRDNKNSEMVRKYLTLRFPGKKILLYPFSHVFGKHKIYSFEGAIAAVCEGGYNRHVNKRDLLQAYIFDDIRINTAIVRLGMGCPCFGYESTDDIYLCSRHVIRLEEEKLFKPVMVNIVDRNVRRILSRFIRNDLLSRNGVPVVSADVLSAWRELYAIWVPKSVLWHHETMVLCAESNIPGTLPHDHRPYEEAIFINTDVAGEYIYRPEANQTYLVNMIGCVRQKYGLDPRDLRERVIGRMGGEYVGTFEVDGIVDGEEVDISGHLAGIIMSAATGHASVNRYMYHILLNALASHGFVEHVYSEIGSDTLWHTALDWEAGVEWVAVVADTLSEMYVAESFVEDMAGVVALARDWLSVLRLPTSVPTVEGPA